MSPVAYRSHGGPLRAEHQAQGAVTEAIHSHIQYLYFLYPGLGPAGLGVQINPEELLGFDTSTTSARIEGTWRFTK